MAHIKDLIVNGNSRTVGTAYATKFEGPLNGTATYANSAGSANSVAWGNVTGKPSTYYTHPSYTAHGNGLYKVTVDGSGHVSAATTVTSADIRSLGIAGLTGESTLPSSYTGGDVWKAPS